MGYLTTLIADKLKLARLVAIIAIILAIVGAFLYQKHQRDVAIEAQQLAEKARDTAIEDLGVLKTVNLANQATIKQLQKDQLLREKIQSNLKKQIENDKVKISDLLSEINASGPQDDGKIAPVLLNTIRSIQKIRDSKVQGEVTK